MKHELYLQLVELFDLAVEQPASARDAFVERACNGNADLLRELRAMLAADASTQPLLDRPLHLPRAMFEAAEAVAGERIGPFRLVSLISEGGMGSVWLAERSEGGFEQRVALKRVRRDFDSPSSRKVFERERSILARLEHSAIARLVDGGFDAHAAPWFAMEYVDGEVLLEFVRNHVLDLRRRIGLLGEICAAVAYAHGRLVVHRDLKPANILVSGNGALKLLDFGTAGLLADERAQAQNGGAAWSPALWMVTPNYAAPEQLRGEAITTATDVYALGVIAYELLADTRPYTVSGRTPASIERELRAPHPAPSQHAPRAWARRLRGDFDAVVAKAMAFDPAQRYASVEAFSTDLIAALELRPVSARPRGRLARAGKFLRRHRLSAALTTVLLLVLAAGVAGTLWQAQQARAAAVRAEAALVRANAVQHFLLGVFNATQPVPGSSGIATQRELADRASANLKTLLAGQPQARIDLLIALGHVYRKLGFAERSRALLHSALVELDATHVGANDPRRVEALLALGRADYQASDFSSALTHLARADVLARANAAGTGLRAQILYELGSSQRVLNRIEAALASFDAAEPLAIDDADAWPLIAKIRMGRSLTWYRMGRVEDAIAEGERALAAARKYMGETDVETAGILSALGGMQRRAGHLSEAEGMLREAMSIGRRAYGQPQSDVVNNLANVLQQRGRLDESGALFHLALQLAGQRFGDDAVATASYRRNLAMLQADAGQLALAETNLRRAYASFAAGYPEGTASNLKMREQLVQILIRRGKHDEAATLLEEVLAAAPHATGGADATLRLARLDRARQALESDDLDTARAQAALAALDLQAHDLEVYDHVRLLLLRGDIADAAGQSEPARALWQQGLDLARSKLDPTHRLARAAEKRLAGKGST